MAIGDHCGLGIIEGEYYVWCLYACNMSKRVFGSLGIIVIATKSIVLLPIKKIVAKMSNFCFGFFATYLQFVKIIYAQ